MIDKSSDPTKADHSLEATDSVSGRPRDVWLARAHLWQQPTNIHHQYLLLHDPRGALLSVQRLQLHRWLVHNRLHKERQVPPRAMHQQQRLLHQVRRQ